MPVGSVYNMSKFALEELTEGLYYELKPPNIELRRIEQGGSRGDKCVDNMRWNANPDITDYDAITQKVKSLFTSTDKSRLNDPQDIVDEIYALATGRNKQFRTMAGDMSKNLM